AKEKQERSKRLLDLSDEKTQAFYQHFIGTEHKVLFEHAKEGDLMHGFTENYIKVEIPFDETLSNQVEKVTLGEFNDDKSALKIR
ncbi:MAG: tRNA (N(6)-L-threonylcarbamoyladenosine(37)-C(2))-methylthiotransferase MtaB, partial [Bacteroidales bacterium]